MSYFIANRLTISKNFKTFKVKGGDNNVQPRCNSWSDWIDISNLLDMLSSGSLQFGNTNKEQFLMLDALSVKFKGEFGGDWNNETDMYHSFRKEVVPTKLLNLNSEFIRDLKVEMKFVNKQNFIVKMNGEFVYQLSKSNGTTHAHMTNNKESAKTFGEYQARRIMKRFGNYKVEILSK